MENGNKLSARQWNGLINHVLDAELWKECSNWEHSDQWDEACERLHDTYGELKEAMRCAPWGANGCVFITRRSPYVAAHSREERVVEVWINRRLRARYNGQRVEVYPAQKAEAEHASLKEVRRSAFVRYQKNAQLAARILWEAGITELGSEDHGMEVGCMTFIEGQHGGFLTWRDSKNGDIIAVSAPGALRRAKAIAEEESQCDPYYGSELEFSVERDHHGARY